MGAVALAALAGFSAFWMVVLAFFDGQATVTVLPLVIALGFGSAAIVAMLVVAAGLVRMVRSEERFSGRTVFAAASILPLAVGWYVFQTASVAS